MPEGEAFFLEGKKKELWWKEGEGVLHPRRTDHMPAEVLTNLLHPRREISLISYFERGGKGPPTQSRGEKKEGRPLLMRSGGGGGGGGGSSTPLKCLKHAIIVPKGRKAIQILHFSKKKKRGLSHFQDKKGGRERTPGTNK